MKLTQEQLAELIAKVFTNLDEKRKACKENGEAVSDGISTEEILAEVTAILEDEGGVTDPAATNDPANPAPAPAADPVAGDKGEGEGVSPELIAAIIAALEGQGVKSATGAGEKKSGGPGVQKQPERKYANLFLSTGSGPDGVKQNSFQTRIASMSAPERRKTAYGMFGRAVKCIHASGGDIERAAFTAERKFGDADMAHEFKALSATVPADGGYLVPEVYANEIIELLYPSTVIYSLGARRLGMANGNLNIPKIKTGSRALFAGENRAISRSAPTLTMMSSSVRTLPSRWLWALTTAHCSALAASSSLWASPRTRVCSTSTLPALMPSIPAIRAS